MKRSRGLHSVLQSGAVAALLVYLPLSSTDGEAGFSRQEGQITNGTFENAINLTSQLWGDGVRLSVTSDGNLPGKVGSEDAALPDHVCLGTAPRLPGVWYTIRLPETYRTWNVTVDTCSDPTFDSYLGAVSGATCGTNPSSCFCMDRGRDCSNEDSFGYRGQEIQLVGLGGTDVVVRVAGYRDRSAFPFSLKIELAGVRPAEEDCALNREMNISSFCPHCEGPLFLRERLLTGDGTWKTNRAYFGCPEGYFCGRAHNSSLTSIPRFLQVDPDFCSYRVGCDSEGDFIPQNGGYDRHVFDDTYLTRRRHTFDPELLPPAVGCFQYPEESSSVSDGEALAANAVPSDGSLTTFFVFLGSLTVLFAIITSFLCLRRRVPRGGKVSEGRAPQPERHVSPTTLLQASRPPQLISAPPNEDEADEASCRLREFRDDSVGGVGGPVVRLESGRGLESNRSHTSSVARFFRRLETAEKGNEIPPSVPSDSGQSEGAGVIDHFTLEREDSMNGEGCKDEKEDGKAVEERRGESASKDLKESVRREKPQQRFYLLSLEFPCPPAPNAASHSDAAKLPTPPGSAATPGQSDSSRFCCGRGRGLTLYFDDMPFTTFFSSLVCCGVSLIPWYALHTSLGGLPTALGPVEKFATLSALVIASLCQIVNLFFAPGTRTSTIIAWLSPVSLAAGLVLPLFAGTAHSVYERSWVLIFASVAVPATFPSFVRRLLPRGFSRKEAEAILGYYGRGAGGTERWGEAKEGSVVGLPEAIENEAASEMEFASTGFLSERGVGCTRLRFEESTSEELSFLWGSGGGQRSGHRNEGRRVVRCCSRCCRKLGGCLERLVRCCCTSWFYCRHSFHASPRLERARVLLTGTLGLSLVCLVSVTLLARGPRLPQPVSIRYPSSSLSAPLQVTCTDRSALEAFPCTLPKGRLSQSVFEGDKAANYTGERMDFRDFNESDFVSSIDFGPFVAVYLTPQNEPSDHSTPHPSDTRKTPVFFPKPRNEQKPRVKCSDLTRDFFEESLFRSLNTHLWDPSGSFTKPETSWGVPIWRLCKNAGPASWNMPYVYPFFWVISKSRISSWVVLVLSPVILMNIPIMQVLLVNPGSFHSHLHRYILVLFCIVCEMVILFFVIFRFQKFVEVLVKTHLLPVVFGGDAEIQLASFFICFVFLSGFILWKFVSVGVRKFPFRQGVYRRLVGGINRECENTREAVREHSKGYGQVGERETQICRGRISHDSRSEEREINERLPCRPSSG
uniref:Transmembrane protein n=1 Tax=Chromera velia CCMP2878 TaxID=1169474 RepID=A0A0G4HCB7_9ALVE|eukprot:Cvel_6257.t1-p1 / transcript=Cvel_6257.t1 / gene=Cvel_6257 / organism=Chromera_velia_CCMP2878 / gene_product=hypothetical protein / transcript_product=hypothetical protein / location=Cvel_scaffold303:33252-38176(-) / protein_length=1245 / sequence_SO=supercontig / SO=protein_coding / is_pseudo=false